MLLCRGAWKCSSFGFVGRQRYQRPASSEAIPLFTMLCVCIYMIPNPHKGKERKDRKRSNHMADHATLSLVTFSVKSSSGPLNDQ